MRKNTTPEWIKSIPKHKLEEALSTISAMARQAKEEARGPSVPNVDARAQSHYNYHAGRRDALADVLLEFEQHTIMASAQKRKAREPA